MAGVTVVARVAVGAESVALGRAAGEGGVRLEAFARDGTRGIHYVRVPAGEGHAVEAALADLGATGIRPVDAAGDWRLYRGVWGAEEDPLTGALLEHEVGPLTGRLDGDRWVVELAFGDSDELFDFQRYCVEVAGLDPELRALFEPVATTPAGHELTDPQRETLTLAYEEGYFDVPRRTTMVELSERLGISDQAVSERLRRAQAELVRAHLLADGDPDRGPGQGFA